MPSATRNPLSEAWSFEDSKADYLELCKLRWPTAQHDKTLISVLSTSVNRVIAIDIVDANNEPHQCVLRYPIKLDQFKRRDTNHSTVLVRHVRILQWLNANAPDAKAPKLITYDHTKENPIHTPYMVLERLPGKPLNEVLLTVTDAQRVDIAVALAQWHSAQLRITMPRAGHVVAAGEIPQLDNSDGVIAIQPFGMSDLDDMLAAIENATATDGARVLPIKEDADLPLLEVLNNAFLRRLMSLLHCDDPKGLDNTKLDHCRGILAKMVRENAFQGLENTKFSLWHTDLFPRNIIVDLTKQGNDIISGVVDWDSPLFAPGFVSCMPPAWLWAPHQYAHGVGDFIGTFGLDKVEPENDHLRGVMDAFHTHVDPFYLGAAYSRDMAYARIFVDYVQARDWRNHPLFEKRDKLVTQWVKKDMEKISLVGE